MLSVEPTPRRNRGITGYPTRPGGIVGSYDSQGNWKGVTSGTTYTSVYGLPGMTDFAFYNMGAGYSALDMLNLEGTGGTDFFGIDYTGTAGAFTGDPAIAWTMSIKRSRRSYI